MITPLEPKYAPVMQEYIEDAIRQLLRLHNELGMFAKGNHQQPRTSKCLAERDDIHDMPLAEWMDERGNLTPIAVAQLKLHTLLKDWMDERGEFTRAAASKIKLTALLKDWMDERGEFTAGSTDGRSRMTPE